MQYVAATQTKRLFYASLVIWAISWYLMGRLPTPANISAELHNEPLQTDTKAEKFIIPYKDNDVAATPLAEYQLWGMVVSHNDPFAWYRFDITHDSKSIDTRDLCVIWGKNVQSDDYKKISFHNDDYTCVSRWNEEVQFDPAQVSNNHLIADNEQLRDMIANVNVGDQIYIRGKLVSYSEKRWEGRTRNSSTSRTDTGNGACEIIYVQDIHVIDSPNAIWSIMNRWAGYAVILFFVIRTILMCMDLKKPHHFKKETGEAFR